MDDAADAAIADYIEEGGEGGPAPVDDDGSLLASGRNDSEPLVSVPDVSPGLQAVAASAMEAGDDVTRSPIESRPASLPRNSIEASKFRGDSDWHALDGFYFS
jgi:hypothetical protein